MFTHPLSYLLILLTLLSGLSGCGQSVVKDTDKPESPLEIAKRLDRQGDYIQAANQYQKIAAQALPPMQQNYQLLAIKAFLKGDKLLEAKAELEKFDISKNHDLDIPFELVQIKIDLAEQRATKAKERLKGIDPNALSPQLQIEYKQLHAHSLLATDQIQAGVTEWVAIDKLLNKDQTLLRENHDYFWRSLSAVKVSQLKKLKQIQDSTVLGWINLALLTKISPQRLKDWQLRFPNHPAQEHIVSNLEKSLNPKTNPPQNIVLLLPNKRSPFAPYADAIKTGFFAAAKAEKNTAKISVKSVNERKVVKVYQQAVKKGADFVVGPLLPSTISSLANSQLQLPVPTLALNHLETPVNTGNFYQVALSPKDEAIEVAKRGLADGHKSAFVLVPDGDWGEGLLKVFKTEWEKQGGQVNEHIYGKNFKRSIPKALKKIQKTDMVFMVALPQKNQAQTIHKYIVKALGDKLPIYSISRVYGGTTNPKRDAKLNAIMFTDMPWVLAPDNKATQLQQTILQKNGKKAMAQFNRLYAFGVEAYYLLAELQTLNRYQWQGQTGQLSINNMGVIHRNQLPWARFVDGKPQVIE
jgi:outer membrane PBP1 activator LpoA protein